MSAFVREGSASAGYAASHSTSFGGASIGAGALLVAVVRVSNGRTLTSVTDSRSQTWTIDITRAPSGSSDTYCYIVSCPNSAAGTLTVTANYSDGSAYGKLNVFEFSGCATSSPLETSANGTYTTTTTPTSGNLTTSSYTDDVLVAAFAGGTGSGGTTAGSSFTLGTGTNQWQYDGCEYRILSATGTYAGTFTTVNSGSGAAACAAYKGTSAAGGGSTDNVPLWQLLGVSAMTSYGLGAN